MFRKNIGIDLGATQISICSAEDGLLLKEPPHAAVALRSDEVVEVGRAAKRLVDEEPDKYRLVLPLWDPVVKSAGILSDMLRILLRRAVGRTALRPQLMVAIPSDLTEAQTNAIEDAALAAGAAKVHLLEAPLCAALGAGIDFSSPVARMLIHMGASRTEIAVIFIGEMVAHVTLPVGGTQLDSAIIQHMRKRHKLYIGKRTAEQIKIRVLSVKEKDDRTLSVKGRCMETDEARTVSLTSTEIFAAVFEPISRIMDAVFQVIARVGEDMRADIVKEGILLTGSAIPNGMEWFIGSLLDVRVRRAENAEVAAVEGAALALSRL